MRMADEGERAGDGAFNRWLSALEARHLADLRLPEVTRALRSLSSAYVERRGALARGAALDGAGKRAAFALFYGPLHFLLVRAIVRALDAAAGSPQFIADLGCGTGAAGAAWALECRPPASLVGVELHPWAADEARWTCRTLGIEASVRRGDLARAAIPSHASAVIAAFTVNELADGVRSRLLRALIAARDRGAHVLVVEPIAKSAAPWWGDWAAAVRMAGGREDTWRVPAELPGIVGRLDAASGLDHRELTARSLYLNVR